MKTWLYLPLILLVFVFTGCTKTTNEVVIPNLTILQPINVNDWQYDASGNFYYYAAKVPELNNVNQTDGVVVSLGRYDNTGQTPDSYELLPQVLNNQSYFVIHDFKSVELDIKGINGAAAQKPTTKVVLKIVLIPSKL